MKNRKQASPELEFFDQPLSFNSWAENADDYKIIVEALTRCSNPQETIIFLDQANNYLLPGHKHIFDGTISSLLYLVENKQISLDLMIPDELRDLLTKYVSPGFQTHHWSLDKQYVTVNTDKNSVQAILCKVVFLGLYGKNGKIKFLRGQEDVVEALVRLTPQDILGRDAEKLTILNAMWGGIVVLTPIKSRRQREVEQAEGVAKFMMDQVVASFDVDYALWYVYEKLQPLINEIAQKEILDFRKGHPAGLAVRFAAIILIHRSRDQIPSTFKEPPEVRLPGRCHWILSVRIQCIFTPDLNIRPWFNDYFRRELAKRVRLIRILHQQDVTRVGPSGRRLVIYLPILDNFRLITERLIPYLHALVPIFHDPQLPIDLKDEIAGQIAFNVQKIILSSGRVDEKYEKTVKDALAMLMVSILEPLIGKIKREHAGYVDGRKDIVEVNGESDLYQILLQETLSAILEYDPSINSSFFGYIKEMLPLKVKTQLRQKKTEATTESMDHILNDFSDTKGLWGGATNVEQVLDRSRLSERINSCLKTLSPKQRQVIEKVGCKRKLTETECRMKNRIFEKIKKQHPELEDFL